MSRPELEEALLLLRKAQEDADAVKKLLPDTDIADSVVGFHAQQAAETASGLIEGETLRIAQIDGGVQLD